MKHQTIGQLYIHGAGESRAWMTGDGTPVLDIGNVKMLPSSCHATETTDDIIASARQFAIEAAKWADAVEAWAAARADGDGGAQEDAR